MLHSQLRLRVLLRVLLPVLLRVLLPVLLRVLLLMPLPMLSDGRRCEVLPQSSPPEAGGQKRCSPSHHALSSPPPPLGDQPTHPPRLGGDVRAAGLRSWIVGGRRLGEKASVGLRSSVGGGRTWMAPHG